MVPKGWEETKLIDTSAKEKYSFTGGPFGSDLKSSDYTDNGVRIIQLQNIGDGKFNNGYKIFTSEEKADELSSCNIFPGEIILSKMGDPVARATIIPPHHKRYLMASDGIRLKVDESKYDTFFIHEVINAPHFRGIALSKSTGSTRKRIGLTDLKNITFHCPPLIEQQKIAKILSTWDKAISTTERLIDNTIQQKKALMQQLLTGKKRLLDDEGERFEGEWDWVDLEDVCDVKGGKRLPKGNALSEAKTSNPYIRVADMYMGGVDLSDIKYVPESIAPLIKNYTISKDDLFITVAGTLGIVGKIPNELDGANLTENADKLTNIKCDKTFLLYVMMSSIIQRYIEAESTQNAQPKLALARIRGFKVPLPNLEEQQKIATVLTNADKEIELLEQQLADLQQEKKALMQVLLTGKVRVLVNGEVA